MAPMLHRHLGQIDADVAATGRRLLGALAIRHRHANATLTAACQQMIQDFNAAGINSIVLKFQRITILRSMAGATCATTTTCLKQKLKKTA